MAPRSQSWLFPAPRVGLRSALGPPGRSWLPERVNPRWCGSEGLRRTTECPVIRATASLEGTADRMMEVPIASAQRHPPRALHRKGAENVGRWRGTSTIVRAAGAGAPAPRAALLVA